MSTKQVKARRVNITFFFDDTKTSPEEIVDRLDRILMEEFSDLDDVHTRWVAELADSPLFGAAKNE